ncbi:hypothetical protein BJ982_004445 [Sphaerisporangium siamense]|uniref:Uncharacterized protein n=1 Tax=Sphaerisporangium siamense TaxID=795645 RepID=A0A7W7DA95_9ACTN|nr:hypothetical protein [Sphaerisporangium siamense]
MRQLNDIIQLLYCAVIVAAAWGLAKFLGLA